MARPLVVGNWKMHGSRSEAVQLARQIRAQVAGFNSEVVVCPPFPFLTDVARELDGSNIGLGAQNIAIPASGAFTGEVAAEMVADVGCCYALVGHSERRTLLGESDQIIADKVVAAFRAGLVPILCIGETLDERQAGSTEAVIARQLDAVTSKLDLSVGCELVVAYEPVWAIGTGLTAELAQVDEVHEFVRTELGPWAQVSRILYGGSVKPDNAQALFALQNADGALVGGASLDEESFAAICRLAG